MVYERSASEPNDGLRIGRRLGITGSSQNERTKTSERNEREGCCRDEAIPMMIARHHPTLLLLHQRKKPTLLLRKPHANLFFELQLASGFHRH